MYLFENRFALDEYHVSNPKCTQMNRGNKPMQGQNSFELPDPRSSPELFEGLLKRRILAYIIDLFILMFIVSALMLVGGISGIISFGLSALVMMAIAPIAIVLYYGATLGSHRRATIGMGVMDIVLTPARGMPLDGWRAIAHPLVFWFTSWILPPFSLMVALFTPRRQMLHDLIVGVLMVRRSPMESHWDSQPD